MLKKDDCFTLTKREEDIMSILWMADHPLTASQIAKNELSINTVQFILKKLISKGLIKVDRVVQSRTAFCRSYSPCVTLEEFEAERLARNFSQLKNKPSMSCLVASFLDKNIDAILPLLSSVSSSITITTFPHRRARKEEDYFLYLGDYVFKEDCYQAYLELREKYPDDLILITGSLYFAYLMEDYLS